MQNSNQTKSSCYPIDKLPRGSGNILKLGEPRRAMAPEPLKLPIKCNKKAVLSQR